jgi:phosphatidylglycerol:prolipoprotein diacylglycerol transferase
LRKRSCGKDVLSPRFDSRSEPGNARLLHYNTAGAAVTLMPDFNFQYFGLPIFNVMGAIGVLCALILILKRERELNVRGAEEDKLNGSLVAAGILSLAGANAANWFFKPELLSLPLMQRVAQGGIAFYYGMFCFFAVFALLLGRGKLNVRLWVNEIVPSVLLFHAFGRVGCSLAGCCYGRDLAAPFRLFFFDIRIFPARELEAFFLFILFFLFQYRIKENRFVLYLLCYSVLRFFLEFGRGDYRGVYIAGVLSPAQFTSVIIWTVLIAFKLVSAFRLRLRGQL